MFVTRRRQSENSPAHTKESADDSTNTQKIQGLPSHHAAIILTFTHNMPCTLQNGLYFVNIYRNITDINFHPLHMSILYRCNRKIKIPSSGSETSLIENALQSVTSFSSAEKVHTGRSPVRIPGTVEATTEQNGSCQLEPNL